MFRQFILKKMKIVGILVCSLQSDFWGVVYFLILGKFSQILSEHLCVGGKEK